MCQAKSAGGRRCFFHSAGTKMVLNYVHAKTGIDKEQIYAMMKELNKEGKRLDNPTPEEIDKFFNLEEFKTKYDPSLSEQEKVAILKQLLSARLEANENGVRPGVFHAWKNALARTVERFKKPFIGLAMAGTLLFTASCSAGVVNPDNTKGPEETKAPTAAECVIENPDELGDVVALEEVTDEYGTYCHVTVSPDAKDGYITLESSPSAQILKDAGFTEEDVVAAQDAAYKIAIEETLDGSRLDNYSSSITEWYTTSGKELVASDASHFYEDGLKEDKNNNLGLLITDSFAGSLLRDSDPRVSGVEIKTTGFDLIEFENENYVRVNLSYSAQYRSSDENIIATIQKNSPEKTVEQIKAENSDLGDSNPNSTFIVAVDQKITFGKEDLTKTVGSDITYSLFTSTSPNVIETKN